MQPTGALVKRLARVIAAASWLAAAALPAQSLISNRDFDESTAEWTLAIGQELAWNSELDESDCPESGSALVSSEVSPADQEAKLVACIPIAGLESLSLKARHLGVGKFYYGAELYSAANCGAEVVGGGSASLVPHPLEWGTVAVSFPVPETALSAFIFLGSVAGEPHALALDAVVVTERETIFLDGFEGDPSGTTSPCRWCVGCAVGE